MAKTKESKKSNTATVTTEPPEPIYEAFAVIKSERPGDLWHPATLTIKGNSVVKMEREPATLKYIAAERVREWIHRVRV